MIEARAHAGALVQYPGEVLVPALADVVEGVKDEKIWKLAVQEANRRGEEEAEKKRAAEEFHRRSAETQSKFSNWYPKLSKYYNHVPDIQREIDAKTAQEPLAEIRKCKTKIVKARPEELGMTAEEKVEALVYLDNVIEERAEKGETLEDSLDALHRVARIFRRG